MLERSSFFILLVLVLSSACDEPVQEDQRLFGFEALSGPYLGQDSPGTEPKLFMPGLVSTTDYDRCVTFLNGGNLCVFTRDGEGVRYTFQKDGRWTTPQRGPLDFDYYTKYSEFDFTAAPDGRKLYFQTNRPTGPDDDVFEPNIWVVEWNGTGWGEPHPLPWPVNTDENYEAYPTVTSSGTVYFFSGDRADSPSADIYRSRFENGEYLPQERLESPFNTDYDEHDPYVAPDESYLMFGSRRPGGFGRDDTYICFRREDGSWTHPVNIGYPLNSTSRDNRINVTPDGKYFIFASGRTTDSPKGDAESPPLVATYGDNDVYWVDAGFIEKLRSDIVNKRCAADVVREVYGREGIQSAVNSLSDLYTTGRENHYFPLYDLLALCGDMIENGAKADADVLFEALLDVLPDRDRIKLGYGIVCTMNGFVSEGLVMIEEATSDSPGALRWELRFRGSDLLRSSSLDAAEEVMRFNLQKFPDWPLAYTGLASVHERRGEIDEAVELCQKALELNPNDRDVRAMLERLEGK